MSTKAEVKAKALQMLGVLRLGQSAQNQDDVSIGDSYTEVYNQLKTLGLATWASTASVPNDIVPHMVALVAYNSVYFDGVSEARAQRILLKVGVNGETAKREIRLLTTPAFESLDEPKNY